MMCCRFAGVWRLVVVSLAVARGGALRVQQMPRFYGVKTGCSVVFHCLSDQNQRPTLAQWYKAQESGLPSRARTPMGRSPRIRFQNKSSIQNGFLFISDLQPEDSGVYFCSVNGTFGPGTELQAAKPIDPEEAQYRTKMKDGLIFLQGLMLAVCTTALLLRKRTLLEKRESIYEEPQTDHIYQGLEVEALEGLYEELNVYAQPGGTEGPWE